MQILSRTETSLVFWVLYPNSIYGAFRDFLAAVSASHVHVFHVVKASNKYKVRKQQQK